MKLLESLLVILLDELGKRQLPRLLLVIVQLPELLRVHPELARHLHLFVRQAKAPLGLDPGDQFRGDLLLAHPAPSVPRPGMMVRPGRGHATVLSRVSSPSQARSSSPILGYSSRI